MFFKGVQFFFPFLSVDILLQSCNSLFNLRKKYYQEALAFPKQKHWFPLFYQTQALLNGVDNWGSDHLKQPCDALRGHSRWHIILQ